MQVKNTSPAPFTFSGPIPQHYDDFLGPMFFEPYAIEVSKRVDPSLVQIAIEIAAGTGRVTRHLRRVIPTTSTLIASDISEDMLAIAKEKLRNDNINWQLIDAQNLPFADNSIDLVVCCFGYMLVADKEKAFREAYRILRKGGMLIFTTWDRLELNAASFIYRKAALHYLEDSVREIYNLPFLMNDKAAIKKQLLNTGFSKTMIETVEKTAFSPSANEAAEGLARGGSIYNEIVRRNPAWVDEIIQTVEKELGEKYGTEPMIAPMAAVICQAWK